MRHMNVSLSSWTLVTILSTAGVVTGIVYFLTTRNSDLWVNIIASVSVFLGGLFLIYMVVDRRIKAEKEARLRPVEYLVLKGVSVHAQAVVRIIGIYAQQDDLKVKTPNEDNEGATQKTEAFAKRVIQDGLNLPPTSLNVDSARTLSETLDDILKDLFSLQGRYSFVIEEHPYIATLLIKLGARQTSIKSALYWTSGDMQMNTDMKKQLVERKLTDTIKICDELAKTTSSYLEHIRSTNHEVEEGYL